VAYAVMSFIMTATPISMHVHHGFSSGQTSAVISAHLLGMYLPSLATPWFMRHLGVHRLMRVGIAAMASCVAIAVFVGEQFAHYFVGLVLLGVGWNFMFVAATALLTTTYSAAERFRAQGTNDLTVFGSQALASLLAGPAISQWGWTAVNVASVPLLVIVLLMLGRHPAQPLRKSATAP
jgi:MFS family permease